MRKSSLDILKALRSGGVRNVENEKESGVVFAIDHTTDAPLTNRHRRPQQDE